MVYARPAYEPLTSVMPTARPAPVIAFGTARRRARHRFGDNHLRHEMDHLAVDDLEQVFSIDLVGHLIQVIEGVSYVADCHADGLCEAAACEQV
jgi:hypothetical protein